MSIANLVKRLIAITAMILLGFIPLQAASSENDSKAPDYKEFQLFYKIAKIVQKNYVKEVTAKELLEAATSGMLQSLDPHSQFFTEEMFKELGVEIGGELGGLGIEIALEDGLLTIVSPIENTPAFKAGLKPGDKIIKIDGESTKNITLLKAVKMIRGPQGSKATLRIMREGFNKFKDYTITREAIHVRSVKKQVMEPGCVYLKLVNFQEGADRDLLSALREFGDDAGMKGIILDLRNNPGGLLDQAVKVSNMFIDKGLIVHTDGRAKDQRMEFRANTAGKHYKFKMATLINQLSASESEIVAGALQDHDRSLVLGERSFGNGTVQTIIPLENGTGMRLTTAYWYTPKGRVIQKTGIVPDVNMKEEMRKQEESQLEKPVTKKILAPENDQLVKVALAWLKSDVTVKQVKLDNQIVQKLKDIKRSQP